MRPLSEINDMGVNKKVYEEQLKLIRVFNGEDTSKFQPWIKCIEKIGEFQVLQSP